MRENLAECCTAVEFLSQHPLLTSIHSSLPASRRYKVYSPVRNNSCCQVGVAGRFLHLQKAIFPSNEERDHLLSERRPL